MDMLKLYKQIKISTGWILKVQYVRVWVEKIQHLTKIINSSKITLD